MNCSSLHAYFVYFISSYSGVVSFLKAARRAWASNGYARPPSCSVSLSRITMKVYRRQSPRPPSIISLMHVVFSHLLPLVRLVDPFPHVSLCVSLSRSDPFCRETRLYSSYFPRVSRSTRYSPPPCLRRFCHRLSFSALLPRLSRTENTSLENTIAASRPHFRVSSLEHS